MTKIFITSVIAAIFASISINAFAVGKATLSLDYAQSELKSKNDFIKKIDDLEGINIKYRYEINNQWGMIGSITYTEQDKKIKNGNLSDIEISYSSLSIGPSYRFNDYISIYGLVGFSRSKIKVKGAVEVEDINYQLNIIPFSRSEESKNKFVYGAGVQFNPVKNVAIDISYEYAKLPFKNLEKDDIKFGTWMLGVGYRF